MIFLVFAGASALACASAKPPVEEPLAADPPLSGAAALESSQGRTELERGVTYLEGDKVEEAMKHFELALASDPNLADAHFYLGVCKEKLGDKLGAEDGYKRALELDPKALGAAQNLGAMYLDDPSRTDDAIAVLAAAAKIAPEDAGIQSNLGFAYARKKDVEHASAAFAAAIAKADSASLRLAYGELLLEANKLDQAAEQLKKGLALVADDVPLLATFARDLGHAKAFGDCVAGWDRAIKLKADEAEFFVRRGLCKHELSDEAGARKDYEAAIKLNASFAAAHYYLGMSYVADKRRAQAMAELDKAKKLGEGTPIGKQAADKLKELSRP